jgi:hypothetical protein
LAGTADELNARRAALLLRCQRSREERRRIEATRAEHAHATSRAAEAAARERLDSHIVAQASQIEAAHAGLRGQTVDLGALQRLADFERQLQHEAVSLTREVAEAGKAARHHEQALAAATSAVRAEIRVTRKRARLSETMQIAWRRAVDEAEEAERDDQATDDWNRA